MNNRPSQFNYVQNKNSNNNIDLETTGTNSVVSLDKEANVNTQENGLKVLTLLNDNKAGMIDLNKEKINQIIYEASKGSKFYENEIRKENKIKKKIEQLNNELLKFSDNEIKNALVQSNFIYDQLKKQIDLTRILVHIDMDAFYAAVEMRDNPELQSIPMAVGCSAMLSTSNYIARRYGVRAAMPGFIAKKLCPQLTIVPLHFEKYQQVSLEIQEIFKEYDSNFLQLSLDEAYLDLTDYIKNNAPISELQTEKDFVEIVVEEIRNKVFEKTKLTCSAGIAPNTMLSKICSDFNKPNGQFYLKSDYQIISNFVQALPIRKIAGIGHVTEQILKSFNILTCNDLYEKRNILYLLFSESTFISFMQTALGISSNRLEQSERKSMSVERTFQDMSNIEDLLKVCKSVAENLANDLCREKLGGRTISLKYKLSTFVTKQRSKTFSELIFNAEDLFTISKELLLNEMKNHKNGGFVLRLLGIRVTHLDNQKSFKQKTVDHFFHNDLFNKVSKQMCPICGGWFQDTKIQDHASKCLSEENDYDRSPLKFKNKENQKSISSKTQVSTSFENLSEIENPVECPICGAVIKCNLNSHIDICLNKQTVKNLVRDSMNQNVSNVSRKRKTINDSKVKQPEKKTLLSFWEDVQNIQK
ncbi:DNA polymerase kappa [Hydra vulgaris]|uniref:DNA polymerase kappa n=1 Tax=Hydra vulgaris TaxID=6087 RepID=A0ABM4CR47_HYDVU